MLVNSLFSILFIIELDQQRKKHLGLNLKQQTRMQNTYQQSSEVPQAGQRADSISSEDMKSALESLTTADKTLSADSMMSEVEDYLKKAAESNTEIPSGYKQEEITKDMMADAWAAQYHPGKG